VQLPSLLHKTGQRPPLSPRKWILATSRNYQGTFKTLDEISRLRDARGSSQVMLNHKFARQIEPLHDGQSANASHINLSIQRGKIIRAYLWPVCFYAL